MVYSVNVYDKVGEQVWKVELNDSVFAVQADPSLMQEYVLLQASNARINIASSKTRGDIVWSGKKLFKQKWTWNARAGGKSSPTRRKWWVAFGPKNNRNYTKSMTKKARRLALSWILSLKAKEDSIICLKSFDYSEAKTKNASSLLKNIWILNGKVLVVMNEKNETIEKSFRNLENVKYLLLDYLNPYDLLKSNKIMFLEDALLKINSN